MLKKCETTGPLYLLVALYIDRAPFKNWHYLLKLNRYISYDPVYA